MLVRLRKEDTSGSRRSGSSDHDTPVERPPFGGPKLDVEGRMAMRPGEGTHVWDETRFSKTVSLSDTKHRAVDASIAQKGTKSGSKHAILTRKMSQNRT